jgi:HSP20 family molecular chaperone IbpA
VNGGEKMSERDKDRVILTPGACFDHDLENYYIEVELPGVAKGHIEVTVSEQSVCVVGSRDDAELLGCWYLAHKVIEDKARAKYENGMLSIIIPLQQAPKGKKIKIE